MLGSAPNTARCLRCAALILRLLTVLQSGLGDLVFVWFCAVLFRRAILFFTVARSCFCADVIIVGKSRCDRYIVLAGLMPTIIQAGRTSDDDEKVGGRCLSTLPAVLHEQPRDSLAACAGRLEWSYGAGRNTVQSLK